MFCSNCGKTIQGKMNFCNACGTPTESVPAATQHRAAGVFVVASVFIALFGLAGLFPLLKILLDSRLNQDAVGVLVFTYLATWLAMFSVILGLGWKLLGAGRPKKSKVREDEEYHPPALFKGVSTSRLPAGDPGFGSVTDSTTRTLDEVLIERE